MEQVERYNYVFEQYDGDSFIYDSKEGERIDDLSQCADILNKKEKEIERWFEHKKWDAQINRDLLDKIEELETRLSNCIELPKYEKGQKIYYIRGGKIEEAYFQRFNNWITADVILNPHEVTDDDGHTDVDYDFDMVSPEQMFKAEEEAKAKLEELKNG